MSGACNGIRPAGSLRTGYVPVLTALLALSVYLLTLTPEVGPGDAAELALQAYQLGVTHPPGYPVHTFLGKLVSLFVGDAARATTLLSAVCSAIAVGLLCSINLTLTGRFGASVFASLLFAFAPTVWKSAVTTEVYNVNVCIVGWALLIGIRNAERRSLGLPLKSAIVLGVSFGSSLANVLLLPGFVCLNRLEPRRWFRALCCWLGLFLAVAVTVLSWSYFRSHTVAPLGTTHLPDTLGGFLRYLRAAQYIPVARPSVGFYLGRIFEDAQYWAASFLWVGAILGVIGFGRLWRHRTRTAFALALMFVGNLGFFTLHTWSDYKDMTVPSHFVFAIWIACGAQALEGWRFPLSTRLTRGALYAALAGGALVSGARNRWTTRQEKPVTEFVRSSFELLPAGAVVAAKWYRFTPLRYFQQVKGLRKDLRIIERAEEPRRYGWGTVADWRTFVYDAAKTRPVAVDVIDPALARSVPFTVLDDNWYLVDRTGKSAP